MNFCRDARSASANTEEKFALAVEIRMPYRPIYYYYHALRAPIGCAFFLLKSCGAGMLKACNSNNPILRPTGRSVGWDARQKSACQRHATTRLANSSVFSTRHRCAASAITPHRAPLRFACVGLLKYRASHSKSIFQFLKNIIASVVISNNKIDKYL